MKIKKIESIKKEKNDNELVFYYSSKEIILAVLFVLLQILLFMIYQGKIDNLQKNCVVKDGSLIQYPGAYPNSESESLPPIKW